MNATTTHYVTLVPGNYGRESRGVFRTAGPGFHNPEFRHKVCAYSDGTVRLSAVASVIAARPIERAPELGTVRIGDTVEIEGMGVFRVTRKALSDPHLVPVEG
ncbi:hypothetical protein ACWD2L_00645 [Streptomyces sp. NPDC002754]